MKFKLIFLLSLISFPMLSFSFINDSVYDVDFSRILGTEIIEHDDSMLKILIITNNKFNRRSKLTFYYNVLKGNEIIEKKILPISFVSSKKESELLKIIKLNDGNLLVLTLTSNQERELVSRIISKNGEILKEAKIAENIGYSDIKVDLKDSIIKISFYDINKNKLYFKSFNHKLEIVNKIELDYKFIFEEKFSFDKIFYINEYAYCIEYNKLTYKEDVKKIPQFKFIKIDLNKGALIESKLFNNNFHIVKPIYFFNNKSIDIFFLMAQDYNGLYNCSLSKLSFDITNFNFKTSNYLTNIWDEKIIPENFDSLKKVIFSQNSYLIAKGKINRLKIYIDDAYNSSRDIIFKVQYESISGKYIIAYQTFESYPNIDRNNYNSSISHTIHEYSNTFIYFLNTNNNNFKLLLEHKNSFKESHINTKSIAFNYFSIVPFKENSKFIYTDISKFHSNYKEAISFKIINNYSITSKILKHPYIYEYINLQVNTLKYIGNNTFLCVASTKYEGDRLFIFNLDKT